MTTDETTVRGRRRSRTARMAAVALVAAVTAAACGDDGGSGDDAAADPLAERLAGRYAHYDVVAYQSADMKTHIVSFGFTDLDLVDGELQATESFCSADHRTDQPIDVEMPDLATQAIVPESTPVLVTSLDDRARLYRPPTPTPLGVDLEDPADTPLPTDPDDPRFTDPDDDGNPGVTVTINVTEDLQGELYLARREIFAYTVDEQPDGSLVGVVTDDSEQTLLGASDDAFLTDAPWVQNPDLSLSPILLLPVERDWDCERLMAERDDLFPPTPEIDW